MVKSILVALSVLLIASDAQLSTVSKRFRNNKEQGEFGRKAPTIVRKSSRGQGRKRELEAKAVKEDEIHLDATSSMSMGSDSEIDFSMSTYENMSISIPDASSVSMSMNAVEELPGEEEVVVLHTQTPAPTPTDPIGCNGDEFCPEDMKCQCWLFCRFCFFPPCGTCVPK
ncbi:hypothetical protein HJC23_001419 [Cyclotella cryptica]|uniref:Uncharacterized protein n=1 Tax=Cyclotella cryptica TaxID=29204 RepID=A0ABD3PDX0_9STRA|eukprot:CCRYP_015631-RA/>CCRYP_015631-RA protein AED:0.26 eAED:0.26 QI:0/-1/0/1/-1/1/1/0/169